MGWVQLSAHVLITLCALSLAPRSPPRASEAAAVHCRCSTGSLNLPEPTIEQAGQWLSHLLALASGFGLAVVALLAWSWQSRAAPEHGAPTLLALPSSLVHARTPMDGAVYASGHTHESHM